MANQNTLLLLLLFFFFFFFFVVSLSPIEGLEAVGKRQTTKDNLGIDDDSVAGGEKS
jgi:hypothetical protein